MYPRSIAAALAAGRGRTEFRVAPDDVHIVIQGQRPVALVGRVLHEVGEGVAPQRIEPGGRRRYGDGDVPDAPGALFQDIPGTALRDGIQAGQVCGRPGKVRRRRDAQQHTQQGQKELPPVQGIEAGKKCRKSKNFKAEHAAQGIGGGGCHGKMAQHRAARQPEGEGSPAGGGQQHQQKQGGGQHDQDGELIPEGFGVLYRAGEHLGGKQAGLTVAGAAAVVAGGQHQQGKAQQLSRGPGGECFRDAAFPAQAAEQAEKAQAAGRGGLVFHAPAGDKPQPESARRPQPWMRLQALQQKGQRRRHGPEVVYGPGMPEKILPKGGGAMPDQQPGAQQGRCLFARGTRPGQPCHQQQKKQKDQDVAAVEQQLRRQREKLNAGQHRDPPAVGHVNAFLGEQNIPKPLQPADREQGAVLGIVQAAGIEIVVGN